MSRTRHLGLGLGFALALFGWGVLAGESIVDPGLWNWQKVAAFGGEPTHSPQTFVIAAAAYVVCGATAGGGLSSQVWRYDAARNEWQRMRDFPGTPINKGVGFSIGGAGYVCLGSGGNAIGPVLEVWQYDPAADTWARKADFPGAARLGCAAVTCGEKAYAFGGDAGGHLAELWEYDPAADVWTRKPDCPGGARYLPAGFSIAGKAYFATGGTGDEATPLARDVWEYDPGAEHWTRRADLGGSARAYAVGLAVGGRGYVALGIASLSAPQPLTDVWEYDPQDDRWIARGRFGGPGRIMATGFSLGPDAYLGLGSASPTRSLSDVWRVRTIGD